MTEGRTPDRTRAHREWRTDFLDTLSRTSNVAAASRAAGIDPSTVYRLRRSDPEFRRAWFDALCDGYDMLELELLRRLRLGEPENPAARRKRKFDNATSFRLLAAHREAVIRMRAREQELDEEDIIASINAKLDLMRERMKEESNQEPLALPAPDATPTDDDKPDEDAGGDRS